MSKSLEIAIQEVTVLPKLINEFGKLLFPVVCVNTKRRGKTKLLPAGTLLSLLVELLMLDQQEMALEQSSFSQVCHQEWKGTIQMSSTARPPS